METRLVPQDIFLKHEKEWQAIRLNSEVRADADRNKSHIWSTGQRPGKPDGADIRQGG